MTSLSNVKQGISRSGAVSAPYEQALFAELQMAIDFYNRAPDALIQILHRAQELFGYLREDVVEYIAHELRLPISQVYGVIGFYSFFSRVPQGKYTISVCMGTACYVRGAETAGALVREGTGDQERARRRRTGGSACGVSAAWGRAAWHRWR